MSNFEFLTSQLRNIDQPHAPSKGHSVFRAKTCSGIKIGFDIFLPHHFFAPAVFLNHHQINRLIVQRTNNHEQL